MARAKPRTERRSGERGAALIAVLGFLAVMSLIAIGVIGAARGAMSAASRHIARVQAQAAVDSAVNVAIQQLVAARGVRPAILSEGQDVEIGGFKVTVSARPESAKIDLNFADVALLMGMFHAAGADDDRASALASAVQDWRDADDLLHVAGAEQREYEAAGFNYGPANKLFESVDELRYVLGVTEPVFACLKSEVTVFAQGATVDLDAASPFVRRAAGVATGEPGKPTAQTPSVISGQSISAGEVFEITARLDSPQRGVRRAQRVIVRITGNLREPYWVLASEAAGNQDAGQRSCPSAVASAWALP